MRVHILRHKVCPGRWSMLFLYALPTSSEVFLWNSMNAIFIPRLNNWTTYFINYQKLYN